MMVTVVIVTRTKKVPITKACALVDAVNELPVNLIISTQFPQFISSIFTSDLFIHTFNGFDSVP